MPDDGGANAGADGGDGGNSGGDGGSSGGGDQSFTQADVDRIVQERISKERAKFGDVNELRRKASKLDEIEAANKSEMDKLNDRATAAESKASTSELAALRLEVALETAPDDVGPARVAKLAKRLTGSTREEIESDAKDLWAEFGAGPKGDEGQQGKNGRPAEDLKKVPIGGKPEDTKPDMNDWMRQQRA